MKEFMKKQSAGFYFSAATIILALTAMFIYVANANNAFYSDFKSLIVVLTVAAIAAEIAFMVITRVIGEKRWLNIVYLAVPVLLGITAMVFVSFRAESAGIILGSDLDKGNALATGALTQAFVGIAFYFLTMIISLIGSFFNQLKE
jgi:hypothetical protein